MPSEPLVKRLITFVDGQALFHASKEAFGYIYPNYDVLKLSQEIARNRGWALTKVYFYTGIPAITEKKFWHNFWTAKLAVMGTRGIEIFTRPLRYVSESVSLKDGSVQIELGGKKGSTSELRLM